MTLDLEIKQAQQVVSDLSADETELARLESEQGQQIAALKATGARDFAALAELEGKRAALGGMLGEQRAAIQTARGELARLEAAREYSLALEELRGQIDGLEARRKETDALLKGLRGSLHSYLERIAAARGGWASELETARQKAMHLYSLPPMSSASHSQNDPVRAAWQAAFQDIGAGADTALGLTPAEKLSNGVTFPYEGLDSITQAAQRALESCEGLSAKKTVITAYRAGQ